METQNTTQRLNVQKLEREIVNYDNKISSQKRNIRKLPAYLFSTFAIPVGLVVVAHYANKYGCTSFADLAGMAAGISAPVMALITGTEGVECANSYKIIDSLRKLKRYNQSIIEGKLFPDRAYLLEGNN